MSHLRILPSAEHRIDDIYFATGERWGAAQADRYLRGLYERFHAIAARDFPWRPLPAEFGVEGYVCRYESHMIYWRVLANGGVGIVSVLHRRMNQIARFRDDFDADA
ncbi:type II toxin-antitoxin system RelE/ParE family toxin [Phenylobacterium sp.]|uniref:type II toxin-antitoxin system RelE/ParE family toxin n=1 Tax=Phenylobacterium sp. TaxID=1871053 RepID=UPI0025CF7616|nr:type II toxin-antitoxin system RelE/ParE family toxin [Phenylobacterium sp.]MBX3485176.1 type II toxin-antitoxin system RelE/ParE family toxin [Phenylobacterium sp.]